MIALNLFKNGHKAIVSSIVKWLWPSWHCWLLKDTCSRFLSMFAKPDGTMFANLLHSGF